jgi:hypothetical protein
MKVDREPRSLEVIQLLLDNGSIKADAIVKYSENEAFLMCFEINESSGRVCKKSPTKNKRCIQFKCLHPEFCSYNIQFLGHSSAQKECSHSLVQLNRNHSKNCRSPLIRGTQYEAVILAQSVSALVRDKIRSGNDVSTVEMKHVLKRIVYGPIECLDKSKLSRAKQLAHELAFNLTKLDQIPYLKSTGTLLKAKGHKFLQLFTKYEDQVVVLQKNAKSDYDRKVKQLKDTGSTDIPKFNKNDPKILEPLKLLDKTVPITYGYVYSGKHVSKMLPKLKTIFVADGAHMKDNLLGTCFSLWGYDSDERLVCVALSYIMANEDEERWTLFLQCVKNWYPYLDVTAIITDGDKGIEPALASVMPGWQHLLCYRHVASNVNKKCNIGKDCSFSLLFLK